MNNDWAGCNLCGKYHYTKKLKNVGVNFTANPIWVVATPKHMLEVVLILQRLGSTNQKVLENVPPNRKVTQQV